MKVIIMLMAITILVETTPITKLKFDFAIESIPFPAKKAKGGEDASYASQYVLAVADGVGGWNARGVDPAKYSRKLAENTEKYSKIDPIKYRKNPKALLLDVANNNKETGSSTFVIATIDPESNILRTSYIGDSSYFLIRSDSSNVYKSVFRSKEQQHKFNFPFQIGSIGDNPSESLEFTHELIENDLLILGTDGLFDNLFDHQILNLINENTEYSLAEMSKALGELAFKKSLDTNYRSPFAVGAQEAGLYFIGGKSDDITIIVARLIKDDN